MAEQDSTQETVQEPQGAPEPIANAPQGEPVNGSEVESPYQGKLIPYICVGGAIGLAVGWLIAVAAGINPWGGVIAGAIAGGAIGLYVVETKRF